MYDFLMLTLAGALVGNLIPTAKESGVKKAISVLVALSLILAVATPIAEAIDSVTSFPADFLSRFLPDEERLRQMEEDGKAWVERYSVDTIEAETATLIENRYGLENGTVDVQLFTDTDGDGYRILSNVCVFYPAHTNVSIEEVAEYVRSVLVCPCEVIVSENYG